VANCVFCRVAAGEVPARIVAEDECVVAFEDINPQAPVHVLVIPRDHVVDIRGMRDGETLGRLVATANRVAELKSVAGDGYRLVVNVGPDAGQSVFHLHVHVLGGRRLGWPPG
jgi:histidine triad (HIT) family protein